MSKIEEIRKEMVGFFYQNQWGEYRIPLWVHENEKSFDITYIHSHVTKSFIYNPYMNTKGIASWQGKWKKTQKCLSDEQLLGARKSAVRSNELWEDLNRESLGDLFNLIGNV